MGQKYADDDFFLSLYPQFYVLQRAQWRVDVLTAVDGTTYTIEANGTDHSATANAQSTLASVRAALKAAVNAGTIITAASSGAASLVVKEVIAGNVTAFAVSPEGGLSYEQIVDSDTWADLRAAWLEATKQWIDLCAWGLKADVGHAALAAHFITKAIGYDPATTKPHGVSSMRLGPAQVDFKAGAIGGLSDQFFGTTDYGLTYLELRSFLVLTPATDLSCPSFC